MNKLPEVIYAISNGNWVTSKDHLYLSERNVRLRLSQPYGGLRGNDRIYKLTKVDAKGVYTWSDVTDDFVN